MTKIGYARVSTDGQNPDGQHDALVAAGCERTYTDHASGKLARRPELDRALDFARPGDALVITKLDRLARSVELVSELGERGIDLIVLGQAIDTTTPAGRMMFHVLAAIAEFERDLISERTRDGLQAARARGRLGGRPRAMTARQIALAREMYDRRDTTVAEIAATFRVSRPTIYRALSRRPA